MVNGLLNPCAQKHLKWGKLNHLHTCMKTIYGQHACSGQQLTGPEKSCAQATSERSQSFFKHYGFSDLEAPPLPESCAGIRVFPMARLQPEILHTAADAAVDNDGIAAGGSQSAHDDTPAGGGVPDAAAGSSQAVCDAAAAGSSNEGADGGAAGKNGSDEEPAGAAAEGGSGAAPQDMGSSRGQLSTIGESVCVAPHS